MNINFKWILVWLHVYAWPNYSLDYLWFACSFISQNSYAAVKRKIEHASLRHVFVKDIPYVPEDLLPHIPSGFKHTFLIRNPLRTIKSYRAGMINLFRSRGEIIDEDKFDVVQNNPHCPPGLFTKELYDIWKYVCENIDEHPVVIDGDDLLAEPAEVVSAYCQAVGLPYDEKLLRWDSSRSLDVAQTWKVPADDLCLKIPKFYDIAMGSSEFKAAKPMPRRDQLTPDVIRCVDEVMGYYQEMYDARLKEPSSAQNWWLPAIDFIIHVMCTATPHETFKALKMKSTPEFNKF